MPTGARMDKETLSLLEKAAEYSSKTKSRIIRESIKDYCMRIIEEKEQAPYDIYISVHSPGGSGHGRRVRDGREILKKKLEADRKRWS